MEWVELIPLFSLLILGVIFKLIRLKNQDTDLLNYLLRKLGLVVNSGVIELILILLRLQLDTKCNQQQMALKLDEHLALAERDKALTWRKYILDFQTEELNHFLHSKESFMEILRYIHNYEDYCDNHPDFPNDSAISAIAYIKTTYQLKLLQGGFLGD